jgi:hypothetical protein
MLRSRSDLAHPARSSRDGRRSTIVVFGENGPLGSHTRWETQPPLVVAAPVRSTFSGTRVSVSGNPVMTVGEQLLD